MRTLPIALALFVGLSGPAYAADSCPLPAGWSDVVRSDPRYVVFGEIHGSNEAPAFIANLACALAERGERILVAVELRSQADAGLQVAWRLPHARFPAELANLGWADQDDGRGSVAMRDMLVRLHRLNGAGRSVAIVAFNGARDDAQRAKFADQPGQGPHEAAQAANIRIAATTGRYDRVLILVGNLHARKSPVVRGAVTFRAMAMQLAPAAQIVSLNMATAGGATWSCQLRAGIRPVPGQPIGKDAIDCAAHPLEADAKLDRTPFVTMQPLPGTAADPAYDGSFWLGPVTASPPGVPSR